MRRRQNRPELLRTGFHCNWGGRPQEGFAHGFPSGENLLNVVHLARGTTRDSQLSALRRRWLETRRRFESSKRCIRGYRADQAAPTDALTAPGFLVRRPVRFPRDRGAGSDWTRGASVGLFLSPVQPTASAGTWSQNPGMAVGVHDFDGTTRKESLWRLPSTQPVWKGEILCPEPMHRPQDALAQAKRCRSRAGPANTGRQIWQSAPLQSETHFTCDWRQRPLHSGSGSGWPA